MQAVRVRPPVPTPPVCDPRAPVQSLWGPGSASWLLISGSEVQKRNEKVMEPFPPVRVHGSWRAMSSSPYNRDVKRRSHTACVSLCDLSISASPPNLRSPSAMYPHWLRHRRSRPAPSDQISTIEACGRRGDLPPSCATGPGPVAHPASRSITSPPPSHGVGDRDDQTCC